MSCLCFDRVWITFVAIFENLRRWRTTWFGAWLGVLGGLRHGLGGLGRLDELGLHYIHVTPSLSVLFRSLAGTIVAFHLLGCGLMLTRFSIVDRLDFGLQVFQKVGLADKCFKIIASLHLLSGDVLQLHSICFYGIGSDSRWIEFEQFFCAHPLDLFF